MIKVGIGKNNNQDATIAAREASKEALERLGATADLILLFSSIIYDQNKVSEGVRSVAPSVPIAGGTAGWGTITSQGLGEKEVTVAALKFGRVKVGVSYVSDLAKDSFKAGQLLAENIISSSM